MHAWSLINQFNDVAPNSIVGWSIISEKWKFNYARFFPLKLNNNFFLFDRLKYSLVPIEEQYTKLFSYKSTIDEKRNLIEYLSTNSVEITNGLVQKNILAVMT
jgi:hypothetical protein